MGPMNLGTQKQKQGDRGQSTFSEGYAFLKVAGKGDGLDALRQTLGARFDRKRRTEEASEPST